MLIRSYLQIRYPSGRPLYLSPDKLKIKNGREASSMRWELVIALVIAVPIILFPAAYVWYINVGGIYTTIREARARRLAREKERNTILD